MHWSLLIFGWVENARSRPDPKTIKRHERQEVLDSVRSRAQSRWAKRDIKVRQHFMERSFAQGTRYGLKRARWRGRWRVQIQDYLIAIVQNIQLLIAHAWPKPRVVLAHALADMGYGQLWRGLFFGHLRFHPFFSSSLLPLQAKAWLNAG